MAQQSLPTRASAEEYPGPTPTPQGHEQSEIPPSGNYVNPYIETAYDNLSTFALDVDTASYTIARQYLLDGLMPPVDSIRPEEFINYFHQDYPLPDKNAFAIYADGAPSPFHRDGSYLLRIGIQGYDVPDEMRRPLSLTFVIDVSGSMGEEGKLDMVKQSLGLLVNRLRSTDTVAIVAYSTDAWVVLNATSGSDQSAILSAIDSLSATDTTNVEAGLRLGYQLAWNSFRSEASNRVVLATDGVANEGTTDPAGILEFVHGYTDLGVTLTAIGVGMGQYNDTLLEQLADKGGGNYYYVDTLEEARRVFVNELTSTMEVIARNAKVQVDFNPDVTIRYRLIGYEDRSLPDQDFRNDAVDGGAIGAGHSSTAVYAVQLYPGAVGRIATVQLRWEDPDTGEVREINGNLNTFDLAADYASASARFQMTGVVIQFAEMLRNSPYARESSYALLRSYAANVSGLLPDDSDVRELVQLLSIASQLAG